MQTILESLKTSPIGKKTVNSYLDKTGSSVGHAQVLEPCDRNGITTTGYNVVYKTMKEAM